jgi:uncharacterized protein (TIGR02171 family)
MSYVAKPTDLGCSYPGSRSRFERKAYPIRFATIASIAVFSGCLFNGAGGASKPADELHSGMLLIPAKGKAFKQGGAGSLAKPDELPGNTVDFTSDFWMDKYEVTQSFFEQVMGLQPVPETSPYGFGAKHPVHRVSWYDALLFCNARSKLRGIDTVYEYTGRSVNSSGGVYSISGLSTHLDREGYRLPTEAEWEFAAAGSAESAFPWGEIGDSAYAKKQAWYSGNSGNKTHQVGTLEPNTFGLFDMAGNVMEWVNDWKGPYPGERISDFAGARDPGPQSEKPVKGGAFNYGLSELRPANRSATYATIPSAAAEYVGFRCVIRAVPKPVYYSRDGKAISTDPFVSLISRIQVRLSGLGAKLVFVNATPTARYLAYLDYRSGSPVGKEFSDFDKVFYPVISPDGAWVAFATALEGAEENSEIFVRKLDGAISDPVKIGEGFIPRWWVDEAKNDTTLVFTSSAVSNIESRWLSTSTRIQKISDGKPVGPAGTLVSEGGFHDGRSRNGRFLATGYQRLKVHDLNTGATKILFTSPDNGKATGDTSQVCNVSIAPDSSGNTLLLDFGYPEKSALVGTGYEKHQYAFLSDAAGKVLRWFRAPKGEESWNDLEWSNHPDFAVASSTNGSGSQNNLYLLNLRDSSYTHLVAGTNLIQPGLWVAPAGNIGPISGNLDLDSLGQYNEPATFDGQAILAAKMHSFWQYHDRTEGFFLGSSQMADGFDPREITSIKALNLAYGSGGMGAVYMLVRNYILPHAPKTKIVGISVPFGWFNQERIDIKWNDIIRDNKGFQYDGNHDHWRGGLPTGFRNAVLDVPYTTLDGKIDSLGLIRFPTLGWGPKPQELENGWDLTDPVYKKNIAEFEELIIELSKLRIHILFNTFPQSPKWNGMETYSVQGPSWTTANAIIKVMEGFQERYPYFHFMDLNENGNHAYTDEDAHDSNHLSEAGAKKLSKWLDPKIGAILSQ